MFIQMFLYLAFIPTCLYGASRSSPYTPKEYQELIKQGFSTNWFKTEDPMSKYNDKNIVDVYEKGFRNLRIRCDSHFFRGSYTTQKFKSFLDNLARVVDKCLQVGVAPIISWINHHAEADATEAERENYVAWWTAVANHLKKRNHRLSFNLFTELGVDKCGNPNSGACANSLQVNTAKYNQWTSDVVKAIRRTGAKNRHRILILASPKKTGKGLDLIEKSIYKNDEYMMVEYHIYASGPNKKDGSPKYWKGNGVKEGRANVRAAIEEGTDFTNRTNLLTYFGAWMPADNGGGKLKESEVKSFARYFVEVLKEEGIPWSLNVLDRYYDTKKSEWITGKQTIKGQKIDMAKVLQTIMKSM